MKEKQTVFPSGPVAPECVSNEDELDHECTSWILFGDVTGLNATFLHKSRDSKVRLVSVVRSRPGAARQWLGLGDSGLPCMGMNRSGLAGVMNSGEPCIDCSTDPSKKTTPAILAAILGSCDTAAQAVEKLKKMLRAGDYWHREKGSIFLFADTKEAFICELTAKTITVQTVDHGYAYRANIWHNQGMARFSVCPLARFLDSCGREAVVRTALDTALNERGRITREDSLALARCSTMPKGSPLERSVCYKRTNSAADLVIDKEFPGTLSTVYVLIGPPRHTIYLPLPVCMKDLDERITETVFSSAARERFDRLGYNAPIPRKWTAFEKDALLRYDQASEKALKLLRKGKNAEAEELLNRTASEICTQAAELLGV